MYKFSSAFFILFLISCQINAQAIYIKVKKGSAKFNSTTLNTTAAVKTFESSSKLAVNPQSIVVIKQNKKFLQLTENKTYSYNQIVAMLKKQKETSSASYLSSLFSENMQKSTKVVKSGAATRGGSSINWEDVEFEPGKKVILLGNEISFEIYSDNVVMIDSLNITERSSSKLITVKVSETKKINIELLEPGEYDWITTLKLIDITEYETASFEGVIIVPNQTERDNLLKKWNLFLKDIEKFDPEIQTELIRNYKLENKIFISH